MKLLITGGTGFIGRHLARSLKSHDVTTLSRDQFEVMQNFGCYDVIYHLAGTIGRWGLSREQYIKTNVDCTKKVLKTCKGKLIYVSSAGVLGPVENADESFPLNPTNDYEESKAEAEKLVMKYHDYVIVRPEFVYGPGDMHVLPLFKAIRDRKFFLIGKGDSFLHPTYIDDVAYCLKKCMALHNETIIIAGERPVTVKEFASMIAEELGVGVNKTSVPLGLAKAYIWLTGKQDFVHPMLTKSRLDFFSKSRTLNTQKARNLLGYKPVPFKAGIRNTINWYKEKGYL